MDGWKLTICYRVEFPLIRDVPLRGGRQGQSSLSPAPSSYQQDCQQMHTRAGGETWTRLPQLMKSSEITKSRHSVPLPGTQWRWAFPQ
jgi:hypothetical protein